MTTHMVGRFLLLLLLDVEIILLLVRLFAQIDTPSDLISLHCLPLLCYWSALLVETDLLRHERSLDDWPTIWSCV